MELVTERVAAKLAVTAALLAIGIAFAVSPPRGETKYRFVDELVAAGPRDGQHLRVHGFVQAGTIERQSEHRVVFMLERRGVALRVVLHGELPDTLRDLAEVVVVGRLVNDNGWQLEATGVMAKCATKYDGAADRPRTITFR